MNLDPAQVWFSRVDSIGEERGAAQVEAGVGKSSGVRGDPLMRLVSWLALAAGLTLAIGAGVWMAQGVERKARAEFAVRAGDLANSVESRIRAYTDVTYSIRALMDRRGAESVTREQFHRFVAALAVAERYPGLANVSYTYHVPHSSRAAFERRMQSEWRGLSTFEIKPAGERTEYDVLSYIEPAPTNAVAIGLDLGTDPVRSGAVHYARDSGALSTTEGMTLLRDGASSTKSVLLRLAVYDGAGVPGTVESRRQAFAGVAGVAIRLAEMLDATLAADERKSLRIVIHDVTDLTSAVPTVGVAEDGLLYDSMGSAGVRASRMEEAAAHSAIQRISVGDRLWELRIGPLANVAQHDPERVLPYATAAAIFMIAVLLCGLLRSLAAAKEQGRVLRRNVKALEFHRRRLAETQEIASIGGWEWDIRHHKQIWSDCLYRVVGREAGDPAEPTDEFFVSRVVHPADIGLVRDALKQVVEGGAPVAVECRIIRPDGEERIVSAVTRLELADDGARTRVVGTVRDITAEHQAAARERTQLLFVQAMMDAIPTPVFQKDRVERFRACNDAWCQFVGKARDAIIGHTLEEFLPGPHVQAIRQQDRELLARPGTSAMEVTLPNGSGALRQLMVHKACYVAEDGSIAGLVGVLFDITDRKIAEDELEKMVVSLDHRNRTAKLLGEFGEMLQTCVRLDETYEAVAKYLPRIVPGTSGILYRVDPAHARGDGVASWGLAGATDGTISASDCVAVRRGRSRCVPNSETDLNCRHFAGAPPRSYACLPLLAHGELIGMLHVRRADDDAGQFDTDTAWAALASAGEHIALAIASLTLRETLHEQATRDNLTGLYNRHYLGARFAQELSRAQRKGAALAVVMLDIDHFKRFNDTHGHAAGDYVLRELATTVRRAGRVSDIACRYGGEEFVLFMPETSAKVALERADAIRKAVKGLHLEWQGHALGNLTISAGVAVYPEHGDDPDTLLRFADQALYRAKELGRDRVVFAPLPAAVALSA